VATGELARRPSAAKSPRTIVGAGFTDFVQRHRRGFSFGSVAAFLLLWEWLYDAGLMDPRFFSSPWRIVQNGAASIAGLLPDLAVTGEELLGGFLLSVAVGILVGILIGWYPLAGATLEPFVNALNSTPRIVLLPLITLLFGIGLESKFVIVFLGSVFPILINTATGISSVDPDLLRVARAFGATDVQIFRTVAVPASVPFIVSGLRLALGQALVVVIAAEMLISSAGVGYYVVQSSSQFRVDNLFLGIVLVALVGIAVTALLRRVEARFSAWRVDVRQTR
jgi:ABC-type nitrate/sulfonate/bicarbonate transport system permease component